MSIVISGDMLFKMTLNELEELHRNMQTLTKEQKERAWKVMDTGIYNEFGDLIGDKCEEEDAYEE